MNWACCFVSSTNTEYFLAIRDSAPQAIIILILAIVSLATAEALPSACDGKLECQQPFTAPSELKKMAIRVVIPLSFGCCP